MAKTIAVDLEVDTQKAEANLNDVVDVLKEMKGSIDDNKKATEATGKATKDLDSNFKKAAKGVKGFGLALKAMGIGLVIEAFNLFKEVLGENQVIMDASATAFEALSIAFNDFFKFIMSNTGAIVAAFKSIFEDPKQKLIDFADAFKKNIQERFDSYLDTLGFLAIAVKKVFAGDFVGALEATKQAAKESVDVFTGVNNSVDKIAEALPKIVKGITEYAASTVKAASAAVELNKQAELSAVINQGLIEDYDRQAEQQRQIRDDTSKTIEERIIANNKLGEILEEQQKLMLANVDIQIASAQLNFDKNASQENYIALLQAENERKAVLAQIEGFRSEQLINEVGLNQELADRKTQNDDAELLRIKGLSEAQKKIEEEKRANIYATLDAVRTIAGEESKISKGIFLFKQGLLIAEQIAAAKATLGKITARAAEAAVDASSGAMKTAAAVPFPANIPLLLGFAAQTAGIFASIASAVRTAKSASSKLGAGGGGGNISAPSFGGGGAGFQASTPTISAIPTFNPNQNNNQNNVRAYVVQNDISNQNALDKRIRQRATL